MNSIFSKKKVIISFVCGIFILLNMSNVLSAENTKLEYLEEEAKTDEIQQQTKLNEQNIIKNSNSTLANETKATENSNDTFAEDDTFSTGGYVGGDQGDNDLSDKAIKKEYASGRSEFLDLSFSHDAGSGLTEEKAVEETTRDGVELNKNDLEKTIEVVESAEYQQPILFMSSGVPMRSVVSGANTGQLSASQKAQLKMISHINNNVDKVRYTNNKVLNTNIQNSFKNNVGSANNSIWYSINMNMLNDRDDLTKSSNGFTLLNFGYNFSYIDNIDSSVVVSFNQTKSDLKMYSKDIPVNTYDFALSLFNRYDFGSDIILSSMLSYNYNIVKDRRTKNIRYGYIDEISGYTISNFTKPTHKKHYNDLALSLSVLHSYDVLNNVKLTSEIAADYFTTHKLHNILILSPMFGVGTINGFYHNTLFPVIYVKYNTNVNTKKIQVSDTKKVNLDKDNVEYGIRTKIGLNDATNILFIYSGDSNRNNNVGVNVGVEF